MPLRGRRFAWAALVILACAAGVVAAVPASRRALVERLAPGTDAVRRSLEGRRGVGFIGRGGWRTAVGIARSTDTASHPAVAAALAGVDPSELVAALGAAGIDTLVVEPGHEAAEPPEESLRGRLAAASHVLGLRGVVLAPAAYVYAVDSRPALEPVVAQALARVAREIVGGARAPRISSFPETVRRPGNVEVMVLLREGGRARLWRSARGSSVARGLVTASLVARRRWTERERAMGGPIDEKLPWLDVEVSLLEEDGTLAARTPGFVESVFTGVHGVAYERKGAWRYLLPEATRREGEGSSVRAYEALFTQHGLPEDSLGRTDLRLYRLVSERVGRSPSPLGGAGAAPAVD